MEVNSSESQPRVEVTTNAKGECQISVKVYPEIVMPPVPTLFEAQRDLAQEITNQLIRSGNFTQENIVRGVGEALNTHVQKIQEIVRKAEDARRVAVDCMPERAVKLMADTVKNLKAQGFTVAGDPKVK